MYCVHQITWRQFKSINAKIVFCAENYLQEILSLDPYNKQAFDIFGFGMCCVHKMSKFILAVSVTNNLRIFVFYIPWYTNILDKIV